ncbi:MAG: EAL domain-containing protein [Sphingomonas taxi]|uniref:EAL domain-containing protein n=1 Tax=Sphingomonas taxi TaxID=1549858 RepID=A0A2W5RB26_9SPHN|nr:MAG: EAL domain-containing protein [Sphingomonas taxi]
MKRVRACVLVQVGNFNALRRQIGVSGARRTMHELVERLTASLPMAHVACAGRDVVEVIVDTDLPDALAYALAASRQSCAAPVMVDGEPYDIDLVLGGAVGAIHGEAAMLFEEAEAALVEARAATALLPAAAPVPSNEAADIVSAIDRALGRDEMVLHYQPKVHVRRQTIESVEALVRWQHPERGLISPADFIPALEHAQQMERLTLWTVRRAIEDQRRLRALGQELRIFVNISGHLLADAAFAHKVCDCVKAAPDAQIGFEVTETSVIRDPDIAIAHLQAFDAIGVRISIDDYGAGLSSLAYLKQLPASELKIDKLFITQLTSSNRDPLIVRSTIDLAHALDMEVVAEGVETHASLALLSVMGCDMVQGYLISRPIALEALAAFLTEEHHRRATQETRASFTRLAAAWKRA